MYWLRYVLDIQQKGQPEHVKNCTLEHVVRHTVRLISDPLIALILTLTRIFIRLDISTDQPAFQVYSGNGLNIPRKVIHGGPDKNYTKWSAVVIEQESLIDAINNPQWGVDQICELQ